MRKLLTLYILPFCETACTFLNAGRESRLFISQLGDRKRVCY